MKFEITGFEHIHNHSHYSLLDGVSFPQEICHRAKEVNQQFACITDHGMMSAIPTQIAACDHFGIHPIFGIELYLNPKQPFINSKADYEEFMEELSEEEKKYLRKSFHIIAIAHNEEGYKNLVRLSSNAWLHGGGGRPKRPRTTHEELLKHKEGITFSSACYNGEIGQAFDGFCGPGGEEAGFQMVEKYIDMFGDGFYLEMMLLDFAPQKEYNRFLIKAHEKYGIPLVVSNDCHYSIESDSNVQRIMLMIQTKRTLAQIEEELKKNPDADFFELQDTNLWMKSEEELNRKWEAEYQDVIPYELFQEAKRNSVRICEKAKGVKLDRTLKLPILESADDKFKEEIMSGFQGRNLPKTKEYLNRIKSEYELITRKGFSSYFLIQKEMIDEARAAAPRILGWDDSGNAVGPARGSIGGSLTAYCLGIHDIDPIRHDLLFERFLSESRGGRTIKVRSSMEPIKRR
jgi:DNA polymerase-3 subunit alpha